MTKVGSNLVTENEKFHYSKILGLTCWAIRRLQSVPGVVKPHKSGCQILAVLVPLLDGFDELLPGDPLVLVLVHLAEHLLTLVALSVVVEEDRQVCDDFLHFTLADRPVVVDIEHLKHLAQGLVYVSEGEDVVDQHELLHRVTRDSLFLAQKVPNII